MQIRNMIGGFVQWVNNKRLWAGTWILYVLTFGRKPVERDHRLFGHNGLGMFRFAFVLAVAAPLLVWGLTCGISDLENKLLGNYDTDVKHVKGVIKGNEIEITFDDEPATHHPFWAI